MKKLILMIAVLGFANSVVDAKKYAPEVSFVRDEISDRQSKGGSDNNSACECNSPLLSAIDKVVGEILKSREISKKGVAQAEKNGEAILTHKNVSQQNLATDRENKKNIEEVKSIVLINKNNIEKTIEKIEKVLNFVSTNQKNIEKVSKDVLRILELVMDIHKIRGN